MATPTFVVGTGRCGSTLISNMLNLHPQVLSLSEFFTFITDLGTLIEDAFPQTAVDGDYFWAIISTAYAKQNVMLRHDIAMQEVLYPFNGSARFNASQGVPAIMQTTLPHLSDDFDALYDEVRAFVTARPLAVIKEHYLALFNWLLSHCQKTVWVERSGGSLRIVHRLYEMFPEAKFIHIVRDGRDCALSMQRHTGFKMALLTFQLIEILGIDPYESDDRTWLHDLPDDLVPFLPEYFNGKAFKEYDISPSLYGHYWSGEIIAGLQVLDAVPNQQKLTLRYEDILDNSGRHIEQLMNFIAPELCDSTWRRDAGFLVKKPSASWELLGDRDRKLLNDACAVGFDALAAHGILW